MSLYPEAFKQVLQPVPDAVAPVSLPAIRPAMNVPCPNASSPGVVAPTASKDRSGPVITLPRVFSPGTGDTPVSITATSTPAPVYPLAHADWAPTIRVIDDNDPVSAGSYPRAGTVAADAPDPRQIVPSTDAPTVVTSSR